MSAAALCASSSRSAAASRATASARRCARSRGESRSRCTRCRAARRSSTGPCPTSGTSATRTSRDRTASASSTSASRTFTSSSYSEPVRADDVARASCGRTCTRSPSTRTGSRTARRTTRGRGASASRRTQLDALEDGEYEVVVDSTLEPGSLTYGECVLPGERDDEVLLTTHVCHPSLANDNLSGIALLTELGAVLAEAPRALHVPPPLHPGDDRLDHVARAERGGARRGSSPASSSPASAIRRR